MDEALEVCLVFATRVTFEMNTKFMTYVKNLMMSDCRTCESFAQSSESHDPRWFTPEMTADVRLLRAACQDPVFVASIREIMRMQCAQRFRRHRDLLAAAD